MQLFKTNWIQEVLQHLFFFFSKSFSDFGSYVNATFFEKSDFENSFSLSELPLYMWYALLITFLIFTHFNESFSGHRLHCSSLWVKKFLIQKHRLSQSNLLPTFQNKYSYFVEHIFQLRVFRLHDALLDRSYFRLWSVFIFVNYTIKNNRIVQYVRFSLYGFDWTLLNCSLRKHSYSNHNLIFIIDMLFDSFKPMVQIMKC